MRTAYFCQTTRPTGRPRADQFRLMETPMPELGDGEALVENLYFSVDPYMREAMDLRPLHEPIEGRAVGRVVASRAPALSAGDLVAHRQGWRTHAVVTAGDSRRLAVPAGVPVTAYLGILGGTGLTAYVGLTRIARLQPGETLFISAAAGAVGTAAARIARILGAGRVIGSTGSAAKTRYLVDELGLDAAIDYRRGDLAAQLAAAAPDGLHVSLENVGGDHLEAAIGNMRDGGRIAWCGGIAHYNATGPSAAPANLYEVVGRRLRLEGFLVRDHVDLQPELEEYLIPRLLDGTVGVDETIVDGFEHTVDAFLSMMDGGNTGKMIVRLNGNS
jgi:NADPH-dependent curcumin reductase CurA